MKTIQSIDKAILILDNVAKHNGKLSLTDLSNLLEMKITTLHGILSTLEYRKLIYKNPNNGKFSLGVKLFELGKIFEADFSIVEIVHPYMEEIAAKFNETVHLAVPFENKILYIDKVESIHKFRLTSMVGSTEEAYLSAIGLVILAYLPAEFQVEHDSEAQLSDVFIQIKQNGYYAKFEAPDDYYCIAAPLLNSDSAVIGAISIVLPSHRYNEGLKKKIAEQLKYAASEIRSKI